MQYKEFQDSMKIFKLLFLIHNILPKNFLSFRIFFVIACSCATMKTKTKTKTKAFICSFMFWNKPVTNNYMWCNTKGLVLSSQALSRTIKNFSSRFHIRLGTWTGYQHNLNFPWGSCIALMLLSKKVDLACFSPWLQLYLLSS